MLRLGQSSNPSWGILDLHTDHLGNVRAITDVYGYMVSTHNYFPFGEEVPWVAPSYNTHQYTGHERDRETGLDYMMARSRISLGRVWHSHGMLTVVGISA